MPVTRIEKTDGSDSEERTVDGRKSEDHRASNRTSHGYGRPGRDNFARLWPLPGILGIFYTDLGLSIPNRPRTAAGQVRPRWFGHDLSGAPYS